MVFGMYFYYSLCHPSQCLIMEIGQEVKRLESWHMLLTNWKADHSNHYSLVLKSFSW